MERINEEYAALDDAEVTKMLPTWKRYGYVVHVAKLVDEDGNVSPLCAGDAPEPVTLGTRETWVYSPRQREHVTCESCKAAIHPTPEKEGE